jgi:lambda repressor-like predicted transcriptional regulator
LPESNDEDLVTIANGPGNRGEVAEHRHLTRQAHRRSRQAVFDQIRTLREAGTSIGDIARQTGFGPRSIRKWLKVSTPPERRAAAPKLGSPHYFLDHLSRRWAEGCVRGRELLYEIKLRGYSGSFSHLERLLAKRRRANDAKVVTLPPVPEPTRALPTTIATVPRAVDPATGWTISPIVAAALCIKPRGLLTPSQRQRSTL